MEAASGRPRMQVTISGRLFSGMGKGRYYVGHPEYQRKFRESLGYSPYPGTLNVKLEDRDVIGSVNHLRTMEGIKIGSFTMNGESFSSLTCFNGTMRSEKVTLLLIDVTYYNETVAELISPAYLRGKFGLKDGGIVAFALDVPKVTPGRL